MWFKVVTRGFIFSKSLEIEASNEARAREQVGKKSTVLSVTPLPLQNFIYQAMDKTGREVKGRMAAYCSEDVQKQLRARGFFATQVKLRKDK
jgi:hypothetical protein